MVGTWAHLTLDKFVRLVIRATELDLDFEISQSEPPRKPSIVVCFGGSDVPALLANNAELLFALEHLAAEQLRLAPQERDQLSFESGGFKAREKAALQRSARDAVSQVRRTGAPYRFPPMTSRERRLLHLELASSGLLSQSEGAGAERRLVLHPTTHSPADLDA